MTTQEQNEESARSIANDRMTRVRRAASNWPPLTAGQRRILRRHFAGKLPDDRATDWLTEAARRAVANAPTPSPERLARLAAHMGFTVAPADDPATAPVNECECHQWHDVAEMDDWLQGDGGTRMNERPLREIVADESIWEPGKREDGVTREDLTAGILAAGGISCEHALRATTYSDGCVGLTDGAHRWTIARKLGIKRVPVEMQPYTEEPRPKWELEELSSL